MKGWLGMLTKQGKSTVSPSPTSALDRTEEDATKDARIADLEDHVKALVALLVAKSSAPPPPSTDLTEPP